MMFVLSNSIPLLCFVILYFAPNFPIMLGKILIMLGKFTSNHTYVRLLMLGKINQVKSCWVRLIKSNHVGQDESKSKCTIIGPTTPKKRPHHRSILALPPCWGTEEQKQHLFSIFSFQPIQSWQRWEIVRKPAEQGRVRNVRMRINLFPQQAISSQK